MLFLFGIHNHEYVKLQWNLPVAKKQRFKIVHIYMEVYGTITSTRDSFSSKLMRRELESVCKLRNPRSMFVVYCLHKDSATLDCDFRLMEDKINRTKL